MLSATTSHREHRPRKVSASVDHAVRRLVPETREPLKRVVTVRILSALREVLRSAERQDLEAAATASTDFETVVATFGTGEAVARAAAGHPHLLRAQARGLKARDDLLRAQGGTLTVVQVAKHLQVSRQSVDRRRRYNQLLAIPIGRHGYRYPAWQFSPAGTLAGWAQVLAVLKDRDPWAKMIFFLSPNDRLEHHTPLAALRRGRTNDVVAAAEAYGEHGAA
jgi:hypothetical protein